MSERPEAFDRIVNELRQIIDASVSAELEKQRSLNSAVSSLSSSDVTELIIGARHYRGRYLGNKIFGEPAWDILLQLHVAHYQQRAVSVTAAMTFGETPPTTGLRWLTLLEREGLVERRPDAQDHRRQFVGLTETGVAKIDAYIAAYTKWIGTKASLRKLK